MARRSDSVSADSYSSLAVSLRGSRLPNCRRIEISNDRLWLLFPESDFVVRIRSDHRTDEVSLVFSVAVRAPMPSLETWWDRWTVSAHRSNLASVTLREVLSTRNDFLRMLDERFGRTHRRSEASITNR